MTVRPFPGPPAPCRPELSVVVPAHNEARNLQELARELGPVLDRVTPAWEVIFVDDGSTDGTWGEVHELHRGDPRFKGLRLSRNFGHQHALFGGLGLAAADAVITMDADLQHPPEVIPRLVDEWRRGAKVVNTVRQDPADYTWFKRVTSRAFYRVFSRLTGVRLDAGMADFRLLDRQVVQAILRMGQEALFLRGMVQWVGFARASVPFACRDRRHGRTNYSLRKMVRFAWHGITSFSVVPLRGAMAVGLAASTLSFLGVGYAIWGTLVEGRAVPGWASSVAILSFLFGVLFAVLAVLGEYVGRIFLEVIQRPLYLVSESLGFEGDTGRRRRPRRRPLRASAGGAGR
ncbi:MAG: glycosyltransferase family 2 protein [Deferrisomatales bacterium]